MAFRTVTEKAILDSISEKSDKNDMQNILQDGGEEAVWRVDTQKVGRKEFKWPLMAARGSGTKQIIIKCSQSTLQNIQKSNKPNAGGKNEKGKRLDVIIGVQKVSFQKTDAATIAKDKGANEVKLPASTITRMQELGSAKVFEFAINENKVYKKWEDLKTDKETYKALKKIWKDVGNLDDVQQDWLESFYKQQKVLLPQVGGKKFTDFNREGGFMDFITDLVLREFKSLVGGSKDNWNPADIWLIKDETKWRDLIQKQVDTPNDNKVSAMVQLRQLNSTFRMMYDQKQVMGISLKKVSGSNARYMAVNVSKKFLDKMEHLSKTGGYTYKESQCKMGLKSDGDRMTMKTQDCRIFVKGGTTTYNFQIKANDSSKFSNLKYEPTASGAGAARMGKATVELVAQLLKAYNIDFKNDHNNTEYPRNVDQFREKKEDYRKKLEKIKNEGTDFFLAGGQQVEEALTNLETVFYENNKPWVANSKCMQITWLEKFLSKDREERNKIGTDMVFLAAKQGSRYGPFGKIF